MPVEIISFGYLHGPAPTADLTLDLRTHFRDPHVDPGLRALTARDEAVRRAVLETPGIRDLIDATAAVVTAYRSGPGAEPVTVALGCAGGRHRAATVALALQTRLGADGITVRTTHRDIARDVVQR